MQIRDPLLRELSPVFLVVQHGVIPGFPWRHVRAGPQGARVARKASVKAECEAQLSARGKQGHRISGCAPTGLAANVTNGANGLKV